MSGYAAAETSAFSSSGSDLTALVVAALVSVPTALLAVPATALVFLAALGAVAARAGGASMGAAAARVTFWGALAMAATAGIGELFGTIIQ